MWPAKGSSGSNAGISGTMEEPASSMAFHTARWQFMATRILVPGFWIAALQIAARIRAEEPFTDRNAFLAFHTDAAQSSMSLRSPSGA